MADELNRRTPTAPEAGQTARDAGSDGGIDANKLEAMAKDMPDECFLKGRGVLKLTGAIRQLEQTVASLRAQLALKGLVPVHQGYMPYEGWGDITESQMADYREDGCEVRTLYAASQVSHTEQSRDPGGETGALPGPVSVDGEVIDLLSNVRFAIEVMLKHFTRTPSTLADSTARSCAHQATMMIDRYLKRAAAPAPSQGEQTTQEGKG